MDGVHASLSFCAAWLPLRGISFFLLRGPWSEGSLSLRRLLALDLTTSPVLGEGAMLCFKTRALTPSYGMRLTIALALI
jgi:hypothetical protein